MTEIKCNERKRRRRKKNHLNKQREEWEVRRDTFGVHHRNDT